MAVYPKCADLLDRFMKTSLPALWSKKKVELNLIKSYFETLEKVAPFDSFWSWESCMYEDYADTMQELYRELGFHRSVENRVVSPSGADWTFLVYVIRYMFSSLVDKNTKEFFETKSLSIELLDQIEDEMRRSSTPPPNAVPRKDTPELEKEPENTAYYRSLLARLPEPSIDLMLARLHDFIE